MLTLQPYRATRYPPPGPKWVQFGDDIVNGAVDDVRAALERKQTWKREHHLGRLQDDGMVPLSHRFSSHRDPEEQATDAYDRPSPPPPPPPRQERRLEETDAGYETADEGVVAQPSSSILTSLSSGANSTLADMGAGLVHGATYLTGAAVSGIARGLARGVAHLATGGNPVETGGHEADTEPEEVPRIAPKPKARAAASSSRSPQHPYPAPYRHVDPAPYNGTGAHAFYIGSSDDEPPAAAAAAVNGPARGRRIAQRDVRLAEETLRQLPENDYGRGRRRR